MAHPFDRYLPPPLTAQLRSETVPTPGVPGFASRAGLAQAWPDLETPALHGIVAQVARPLRDPLQRLLEERLRVRRAVDRVTADAVAHNAALDYRDPAYRTAIGAQDPEGGLLLGPAPAADGWADEPLAIPTWLDGPAVTLFGPPDSKRMCINAINSVHRQRKGEPAIVARLVAESGLVPRWGADNEDSQTPLVERLLEAARNLRGCYDGSLSWEHPVSGRPYRLAESGRAVPIKRIVGLALPDGCHFLDGQPLPLHLYDLVQHIWLNRDRPEALAIYVPKLESVEEARYLAQLIDRTERAVQARDPRYRLGGVKVILVFEHPRAVFRIRAMAEALRPWFVGGSLGWHDYLAATARFFRRDPRYRIPVKADPDIVIHHIKESHTRLVRALAPIGGLAIGGMYGVLPQEGDPRSDTLSMVGYIRDVVTQLKRGLTGFWVAHPDFVRVGVALVGAVHKRRADPADPDLHALIRALVPDPADHLPLLAFVDGPDVEGLDESHPLHPRAVLAADMEESRVISNSDPEEVRYNVFQALQYLASWLAGSGCVALPASLADGSGQRVFVRVMDDLATTERSRWELWAEVAHGRVPVAEFDRILEEEIAFIRENRETPERKVQIPWQADDPWYPIAVALLRQLVLDPEPVEAVTELLLPFTFDCVRSAADPWAAARRLCPGTYR